MSFSVSTLLIILGSLLLFVNTVILAQLVLPPRPSAIGLLIYIGKAYPIKLCAAANNTSEVYTCEMGGNPYGKAKRMPPLAALAKRLEPQADYAKPESSKTEPKRAHWQGEEDPLRYFGLGAVGKPDAPRFFVSGTVAKHMPPKAHVRVPEIHSERLESTLNHYYGDLVEQEKDKTKYSHPHPRAKHLSRKRSFQDSELSSSDDSSRRAAVIGGPLGAETTSGRPEEVPTRESSSHFSDDNTLSEGSSPARESGSQVGSRKALSKGPSPARAARESGPHPDGYEVLSKGSSSTRESDSHPNSYKILSKGPSPARESDSQIGNNKVTSKGPSPTRDLIPQRGSNKKTGKCPSPAREINSQIRSDKVL